MLNPWTITGEEEPSQAHNCSPNWLVSWKEKDDDKAAAGLVCAEEPFLPQMFLCPLSWGCFVSWKRNDREMPHDLPLFSGDLVKASAVGIPAGRGHEGAGSSAVDGFADAMGREDRSRGDEHCCKPSWNL